MALKARSEESESRASAKPRAAGKNQKELLREIEELRARLEDSEATIEAIRSGGVDALVVSGPEGERVFALEGADYPYRVMLEVMNEGVVTLGADGDILSCNTRFANFLERPIEQLLGKPLEGFAIEADKPNLLALLKEEAGRGGAITVALARADGSAMPVKLSAGAFEVGCSPVLCVVVTDLTDMLAAAEAQLRLASIVETSNDAIISVSLDHTIATWNAAAERIFGFSAQEAVGQPISLIVPRDSTQEVQMIDEKICLEQPTENYETLRIKKSGAPVQVSLTVSPLMDPHANITGISIIARDITAHKKTEAELAEHRQHLEKMVQQRTGELLAKTDELEAANEELRTRRTELEVANEELKTQSEDLRRAQAELETARARYFELYNLAPVGYCTLDEKGVILEANLTAAALLRVDRGKLAKQPISRFIFKEDQDSYYRHRNTLVETDEPQDCELRMVNKDGMEFWAHLTTAAALAGGVPVFRIVMIDISQRRNAEESLERINQQVEHERLRLEAMLDVLPTGVAITDASGGTVRSNKEYERIWAGPRPETRFAEDYSVFKGWWADTGTPVAPEEWASALAVREGRVVMGQLLEIQRFDGTRTFVLNSASPIQDANGNIIGSAVAVQDISDLRKAELRIQELNDALQAHVATLEEVNKELESYSHSVSHDLRTPLRFVNRVARLLLQSPDTQLSDDATQQVNMILRATNEMAELIEGLLAFSQISRVPMKKRRVDLGKLFRKAAQELEYTQEHHSAEISIQDLPSCQGVQTLLKEVAVNLLGNAIKFTQRRKRPRITVGYTETEAEFVYFVQDNGIGFDMSDADTLFLPFERLRPLADFEGSGIGLALSTRIIERHGGRLWAVGEVDKGATFYFTVGKKTAE